MKTKMIQLKKAAYVASFALLVIGGCKKNDPPTPKPDGGTDDPILLDCSYFKDNPNAVLTDNPNAPVDYIVPENCVMTIPDDVTVEPGVTIVFKTDAGWNVAVNGSLKMVGTADKKITLTGEDKSPGAWRGIMVVSNDNKNEIAHTSIEYAGGKAFNSNGDIGAVLVANGKIQFHNNLVQHSKTYGLNVAYDVATAVNISNNIFKSNKLPLRLSIRTVEEVAANNTYESNETNMVEVFPGYMDEDITVKKISVPYLFSGIEFLYRAAFTINPGVEIVMGAGFDIKSTGTGASFNAVGTVSEPIKIRGAVAQPGYWGYILVQTSNPSNRIEHADIRHGGADRDGSVLLWTGNLHVGNTHFEDIKSCAIWALNPENLSLGANTYVNCDGDVCSN